MAKRTNYSNEFKFKVALEAIKGEVTFDELAIKYNVSKSLISNWRKELLERGKEVFNSGKRKEEAPQESKLYQKIGEHPRDDSELCCLVHKLWGEDQSLGYRMITHYLREYHGMVVNHKRVRRIMTKLKIMGIIPKRNLSKNKKPEYKYPYLLRNLLVERANLVWVTDITYLKLPHGTMYLLAIIDVYSRAILGYTISHSLEVDDYLECLRRCVARYGAPAIFNTDQGVQFTSHAWINELKKHKVQISMDGKGRWADNIWIERFWRTIKYCGIFMDGVETVKELRNSVKRFIGYYNEKRLHSSHGYQTPMRLYLESVTENSGTMFQYIYQRDVEQLAA